MYILPIPQKLKMKEGKFWISYDSEICINKKSSAAGYRYAGMLQQELLDSAGVKLNITKGISDNHAIYLNYMEGLEAQEYRVGISESQICLQASTDCGMLYAIQTLRQIIRQEGLAIPCLDISDYPQIRNRGLYYDVTRCRIPTLDYMKKLVDTLSFYKINQLHLYIEHTYMFKRLSEVWRDDTPSKDRNCPDWS